MKPDVAEWYKRGMILIITILVGIIAQDMSEMKGDIKIAIKMTELNHISIKENTDHIQVLEKDTSKIVSEITSHNRRLTRVESVLDIPQVDIQ